MRANFDGLTSAVTTSPGPAAEGAHLDLSDDLEITRYAFGAYALIAAGFILTFVSSSLAFGWWGEVGTLEMVAGSAGMMLFGIATCRLIWMLPAERGPVLIISHYGIRDLRLGNEFLLWDSIADVSTGERRGRSVVVLKLTPALQRQRCCVKTWDNKTWHDRTGHNARPGSGEASADHIVVSPEGLATSFDTLLQTCRSFHAASEQRTALQHNDG
jgi:hypothetical protein